MPRRESPGFWRRATPLEFVLRATLGLGGVFAACAPEAPPETPRAPLATRSAREVEKPTNPPSVGARERTDPSETRGETPAATPSCDAWEKKKAASRESGRASYYSDALAGRSTASGRPYRPEEFTAAHRSLPFGSVVRISSKKTAKRTCAVVTDRGPFVRGRIVDLSRAAAEELGLLRLGVTDVELEVLEVPPPRTKKKKKR